MTATSLSLEMHGPNRDLAVARTLGALRTTIGAWKRAGDTVALVPTMGALHEGHLALVATARERCSRAVVSIFVNPTQFAPSEDFSRYPRTFETDCRRLSEVGCDLVWAPTVDVMYPAGFATRIEPGGAAEDLESVARPQFFAGVATVCCKLMMQTTPDVAIFGEKDYQQLQVVRQMARDLDLPVDIVGHPTVREPDGLAMSSRNVFLSADERRTAPLLHRTLSDVATAVRAGESPIDACALARRSLESAGLVVEYVEVRDAVTLAPPVASGSGDLRVLAAVRLGATRLIDNVAV